MTLIRKLRQEDPLHDLLTLSRQFFQEYEAYHDAFFKIDRLHDNDIIDYFSCFLDTNDGAAFVATVDGKIVGYITVYIQSQAGFWKVKQVGAISGLMVQQDYRRRGIGARLLSEAIAFFEAKGVKYFTVFTASRNQTALAFYARNGMTPLHVTMIGETGSGTEGI